MVHCWADLAETMERQHGRGSSEWAEALAGPGGTCMLPAGHDGPHVFTRDDEVEITFPPAEDEDHA